MLRKLEYQPCLPTRAPRSLDWLHEFKYDGYRVLIQRERKRARLLTRNGHDWSHRYPLIIESALRNRHTSFVIDGEAVLLGIGGVSDFNGLHSRHHDDEVQLYAFDILALDGDDLRELPLSMRKDEPGESRFAWLSPPEGADCLSLRPSILRVARVECAALGISSPGRCP
jgi:bifunctional non-homologous end joining protein LigD